jgi:hypothetical protein
MEQVAEDNEATDVAILDAPRLLTPAELPFTCRPMPPRPLGLTPRTTLTWLSACRGTRGALGSVVRGRQAIVRGRTRAGAVRDMVELSIAVVRLPTVATDVVVTVHRPTTVAAGPAPPFSADDAAAVLAALLRSFNVIDWGLFGPEMAA